MREIKFKAWNKKTKKMIDLHTMTPLALHPDCLEMKGVFLPFHEDLELMQFTGLLDRNGKEIWEGYILREIPELSEEEYQKRIGQVVYEPRITSFMVLTDGGYCHLNTGDWGRGDRLKFTEVVGNIYENPELLK